MLASQVVKSGKVGVTGSTMQVLDRNLRGLRDLIDRSLSEVRLAAGHHQQGRIELAVFIEEMEVDALNCRLNFQNTSSFLFPPRHRNLPRGPVVADLRSHCLARWLTAL